MKVYERLENHFCDGEDYVAYEPLIGTREVRQTYRDENGRRRWRWGRLYDFGYERAPCCWLKPCSICGKHQSPHRMRNEYLSDYPYNKNGRWHLHLSGLCMSCWNKARGIERRMRASTQVAQACRWLLAGGLYRLKKEYHEQANGGTGNPPSTPYMRRFEDILGKDCGSGSA